jgi:Tol biopolymer transport system component
VTNKSALHEKTPSWSPDGGRIVFAHSTSEVSVEGPEAGIYVMNMDGTSVMRLSDHGYQPVWSPNGDKIVFTSNRDGNDDIYSMEVDGANQINLTASAVHQEQMPVWSPDGNKLLFSSRASWDGASSIYVMNADGSQKTKLATKARVTSQPWSPDSSKIVYDTYDTGVSFHIIGADSLNDMAISTGNIFHSMLVWSPDGSRLASNCTVGSIGAICVLKSDGSEAPFLYEHRGQNPLWSPDGSKLLSIDGEYTTELLVMNVDGSNEKLLASAPFDTYLGDAVWSPDSRKIAFTSEVDGDLDIYVLGITE